MSRGPQRKNFREKITETWGSSPPDWIIVLADMASRLGLAGTASALGRSPSMVSAVLSNTYAQKGGDLGDIERRVRGLWMGEHVICPARMPAASISTTQCDATRKRKFSASSPTAVRLWHACRKCPNNPEVGE